MVMVQGWNTPAGSLAWVTTPILNFKKSPLHTRERENEGSLPLSRSSAATSLGFWWSSKMDKTIQLMCQKITMWVQQASQAAAP